jgi:hypothetical protein
MNLGPLRQYLKTTLVRLPKEDEEDPIQLYKDADRAMEIAYMFVADCARIKRKALLDLNENYGLGYTRLGREFGFTKQRARQMLIEARASASEVDRDV